MKIKMEYVCFPKNKRIETFGAGPNKASKLRPDGRGNISDFGMDMNDNGK
jgi:hypothetical protein